ANIGNVLLHDEILLHQRAWRAGCLAGVTSQANIDLQCLPARLVPVGVALIYKNRIIAAATVDHAAFVAELPIGGTVVITEIVMTIAWPYKKGIDHDGVANG